MRIVNLIENTKGDRDCLFEHGLSFYVETKKHRILVDTGAGDSFIRNADRLFVDLKQVDMAVLSHGHYDHAGGISAFAQINQKAVIYMHSLAGEPYFHEKEGKYRYIGIDSEILSLPQIVFTRGEKQIDDGIFLFGDVRGRKLWPSGNRELRVKKEDGYCQDEFLHEQYLVLEEDGKRVLLSGCAHNGILNILDRYREIFGSEPDAVISGFHMQKKAGYTEEDIAVIREIGEKLKKSRTLFYTGHCTGEIPFRIMKECMGEKLLYVHSGDEILL